VVTSGRRRTGPAAVIALLALTLAGCGSGGQSTAPHGSPAAVGTSTAQGAVTSGGLCGSSGHVFVSSAGELRNALASARPGETIVLAAGTYDGDFALSRSGTQSTPITLCGPRDAVLAGESIASDYTVHLEHVSWWRLMGFTVQGGQKGIVADGSSNDLLYGLYVHSTGDEAIHLRDFSSHDTISHSVVRDTGLLAQFFGEGIYVGSAHKNWCRYSGCQPDRSDDDIIVDNNIAGTTAENIDIKEGTTGGQIAGNQFNGTGMVESASTAWVNVKGNGWLITDNAGVDSIKDGFQVHRVYHGWGMDNTFRGNRVNVNGPGYGFYIQSKKLNATVACDNTVSGAASGFSTISCA
jgi:hypothetical protein